MDEAPWPSLGSQVVEWMEANLAFGPGDLLGQPYRCDDEDVALIERMYQVHPKGHPKEGKRRFDTCVVMTRKGTKKSERLAAIAAVELAEDGPVRCDGFRREGRIWVPVGRPVTSPAVWILAFAKEQAEDTSFGAMREMVGRGAAVDKLDVWDERIVRKDGSGEAQALASAPDSRDGGRTTFQGKEESHRWVLPRHKEAHATTRGNLSKRPIAEPWEMHATTAYAPGEGSVAEDLHEAARAAAGRADKGASSRMFFFYRWANLGIKIRDDHGNIIPSALREAIVDASGPVVAAWSDIEGIASLQFEGPGADANYGERVWLNRTVKSALQAFNVDAWRRNGVGHEGYRIPKGALCVAGFDGSRGTDTPGWSADHTGLVLIELATGHVEVHGHWDPALFPGNKIPRQAVDVAIDAAFTDYEIWRLYIDPHDWDSELSEWIARYGEDHVQSWATWRERPMAAAIAQLVTDIAAGLLTHDPDHPKDAELTAHIGHAHKREVTAKDADGRRQFTIAKERPGSILKIDLAMCLALANEARNDAIAKGALSESVVNFTASDLDVYFGPAPSEVRDEAPAPA
jgi:hypothetical protein